MRNRLLSRGLSLVLAVTMLFSQSVTSKATNVSDVAVSDVSAYESSEEAEVSEEPSAEASTEAAGEAVSDEASELTSAEIENGAEDASSDESSESEASSDASSFASSEEEASEASSEASSEEVSEQAVDGAVQSSGTVNNGKIKYDLTNGVLTITGSGDLPDNSRDSMPWYGQKDSVKEIRIGEGITKVGDYIFDGFKNVTKVTLPSSLRAIGYSAFESNNIASITIPENVTSISGYAFQYNYNLSTVVIKSKKITEAGSGIFERCNISKLTLPAGMTVVPDYLFYHAWFNNCTVTIPKTVTTIGTSAFDGYDNHGISGVIFEEGSVLRTIGTSAFEYSKVGSLKLPETVTTIGRNAFANTYISSVTIPANVSTIESYAFENCKNLTTVNIQSKKINSQSFGIFQGCNISKVTFPEGITTIPDYLFYQGGFSNCTITIPKTVTSIGEGAFQGYNSKGITGLVFESGSALKTIGKEAFAHAQIDSLKIPDTVITIGNGAFKETYISEVTIPENVSTLESYAFESCKNLEVVNIKTKKIPTAGFGIFEKCNISKVTFPEGIISIPANLFYNGGFNGCTITIPKTVTTIGDYAFFANSANGISGVIFENVSSLKTIGENAFAYSKVDKLELPESLVSIGKNAFASTSLSEVTIPSNITTIGSYAFENCKNLDVVNIRSKKITTAGYGIFEKCNISKVTFPQGITAIPANLFYHGGFSGCTITIPKTVTSIGEYAFYGYYANGISGVVFENGSVLKEIGKSAFEETMIEALQLPDSLETIGSYAFKKTNIEEVTIPSKVKSMGWGSFEECPLLSRVTLPASVTEIGYEAFSTTGGKTIRVCVPKGCYAYDWVSENASRFNYVIVSVSSIHYVLNGGTNNPKNPAAYEKGDYVGLQAPTRTGYRFDGWFYDSQFKKAVSGGSLDTGSGKDITVYAKWTAKEYNVKYDLNSTGASFRDGSSSASVKVTYDTVYPKNLETPSRVGYTFAGWFTAKEGGTKIIGGTTRFTSATPESAAIYAHWTPISYNVRFNSNIPDGKNTTVVQKLTYDQAAKLKTVKELKFGAAGSSFANWSTDKDAAKGKTYKDGDEVKNLAKTAGATIDLYAQWKTVDYVVFFDANGGASGSLTVGGSSMPDISEQELKAMGIDLSTVNRKNGFVQAMKYGEEFELNGDEFVRKGYTLTGWMSSKTKKVINNSAIKNMTTEQEIITLTAQWKKDTYKITYNLGGGSFVKGAPKAVTSYTVDDGEIELPTAESVAKTGCYFWGWYDNKEFEGKPYDYVGSKAKPEVLHDITLYACWEIEQYDLLLDSNGGVEYEGVELNYILKYNQSFKLSNKFFYRSGYSLDSWNTEIDENGNPIGKKYPVNATIKNLPGNDEWAGTFYLYAIWKANTYKISYDLDGGSIKGAPTSYRPDVDCWLEKPEKKGYKFEGWEIVSTADTVDLSENQAGNQYIQAEVGNYGNVTLKATWEPIYYGIAVHLNKPGRNDDVKEVYGKTELSYTERVSVSSVIDLAYANDKKHLWDEFKKIVALSTTADGKGTTYPVTGAVQGLATKDGEIVHLYAIWGDNANYRITYDNLDGCTNAPSVYTFDGSKDVKIPQPVKPGYVFTGWDLSEADTFVKGKDYKNLTIKKGTAEDIYLYANFEAKSFTATVDPCGSNVVYAKDYEDPAGGKHLKGSKVSKASYKKCYYGALYNLPELSRPGYTFVGYFRDKLGKGEEDSAILEETAGKSTTYYAVWVANDYEVVYTGLRDTGANENPTEINAGKAYALKNPVRKGYTFLGWTLKVRYISDKKEFNGAGVNVTTRKDAKTGVTYVTRINESNGSNLALVANWVENSYSLKISSNGGIYKETGKAATLPVGNGTVKYTTQLEASIKPYVGKFTKKGFAFAGFATDAKGNNMIMDAKGNCIGEYTTGIWGLTNKTNGAVVVYAVWEKVVADQPVVKSGKLSNSQVALTYSIPATTANVTYEVECSTSIVFRGSVTKTTVLNAGSFSYNKATGIVTATAGAQKAGTTNYVRIRQVKTDSQGNKVTGKWSKRFAVR